jgi:hypothetical protein
VVNLTSAQEGLFSLTCLEKEEAYKVSPLVAEAGRLIQDCPFIVFAPQFLLPVGAIRFNMAPPHWAAKPQKCGNGRMWDLIFQVCSVMLPPAFNIGTYGGIGWLPRSHNGRSFLRKRKNLGVYEVGVRTGSSSIALPEMYKDLPRIPPGDDLETFRLYKTIINHGGAGTVQTAAAAGAKQIVYSRVADRDYHDPHNPMGKWRAMMGTQAKYCSC